LRKKADETGQESIFCMMQKKEKFVLLQRKIDRIQEIPTKTKLFRETSIFLAKSFGVDLASEKSKRKKIKTAVLTKSLSPLKGLVFSLLANLGVLSQKNI